MNENICLGLLALLLFGYLAYVQMLSIFLIGSGLTHYLGRATRNPGHGWSVWGAMMLLFVAGVWACTTAESAGNPLHTPLGVAATEGHMEGKEVRFGIFGSALFACITSAASCGAVNAMHDSFSPLGGLVPLFNIELGEVIVGGVGAGLYGMLLFVKFIGALVASASLATATTDRLLVLQLTLWLWFTLLFANFAEALAEGRGKAQADALHDLTRSLAECGSRDEIVWQLIAAIDSACGVPATVCLPSGSRLVAHLDGTFALDESEAGVADWSFRQQRPAGRSTDNLPGARALHLPLVTERRTVGVLVIPIAESTLPTAQRELLESLARQAALVLDREDLRSAAERSRLAAESDRLSRPGIPTSPHPPRPRPPGPRRPFHPPAHPRMECRPHRDPHRQRPRGRQGHRTRRRRR